MNKTHKVEWGNGEFLLRWISPNDKPSSGIVTTAHGYCFHNKQLLVVQNHRGFELPGGHLDSGESCKEAFTREVYEEGCVEIGEVVLLGYLRVEPVGEISSLKYPKESYMAFCVSDIKSVKPYTPNHECFNRDFISPLDIRSVHHFWHGAYEPSLIVAIKHV